MVDVRQWQLANTSLGRRITHCQSLRWKSYCLWRWQPYTSLVLRSKNTSLRSSRWIFVWLKDSWLRRWWRRCLGLQNSCIPTVDI